MNHWIMTDNHLGHHRLHEEELGGRPVGFEETILKNIGAIVQPNEVYIDLGDVAIYQHETWHNRLRQACRGKMILVRGNHDSKSIGWYYDHGWDFVADEILIEAFGKRLLFTHRPAQDSDRFDFNIHGHFHHNRHHPEIATMHKHILVSIEHAYRPVSLRKLINA